MKDKKDSDNLRPADGLQRPYAPPTIWSLRAGIRADGLQDNQRTTKSPLETIGGGTLYEHLFGYDPIRMMPLPLAGNSTQQKPSAENPRLNVISAETNFALMEIAADLPPETL